MTLMSISYLVKVIRKLEKVNTNSFPSSSSICHHVCEKIHLRPIVNFHKILRILANTYAQVPLPFAMVFMSRSRHDFAKRRPKGSATTFVESEPLAEKGSSSLFSSCLFLPSPLLLLSTIWGLFNIYRRIVRVKSRFCLRRSLLLSPRVGNCFVKERAPTNQTASVCILQATLIFCFSTHKTMYAVIFSNPH